MSKFIYICSRAGLPDSTHDTLVQICRRLLPDRVTGVDARIRIEKSVAIAVHMPSAASFEHDASVAVGCFFGASDQWFVPATALPNGCFALVRADRQRVEAATDAAGSRTLWTYKDEDLFICSTSQRAILMYIGSIDFDPGVVPWVLSTGTLGPELGWDKRIQRLPADSCLSLDRLSWSTRLHHKPIKFEAADRSREEHKVALRSAIEETFSSQWSYRPDRIVVPLSGGYDSRTILALLHRTPAIASRLQTVTWGIESRRTLPGSDADIASTVARHFGVPNEFIALDDVVVAPETVLARFIADGEGRVDHVAGYVDGMALWRRLHHSGIESIVRGDEGFGWVPASTERAVRYSIGMALASDHPDVEDLLRDFDLPQNHVPPTYLRLQGESVHTWRDRMYHAFRIPTVLAALSDIKLSYVELMNPFLAGRMLAQVRSLPDSLRTGKTLFKEIADSVNPSLPYASSIAIGSPREILSRVDFVTLLRQRLHDTDGASSPLPAGMLKRVGAAMVSARAQPSAHSSENQSLVSMLVPRSVRHRLRDIKPKLVGANKLGLRAYILVAMLELLRADIAAIRRER